MAPKRSKPKASIKSDYLATVTSDDSGLDSSSGPHQLTSEQLTRAYGLAPPPANSPEYSLLLRTCPPKWNDDSAPEQSKRSSPEVITIDSDDDEPPKQLKNIKRGSKGKGKADDDHACSHELCNNNPRCLNWLGQDKWESSVQAMKSFSKVAGLGIDPSNARQDDIPVGLRNLGATCYANSFLQVWFRDVPFRAGVYACLPPDNGNVEASPLFQLQVLFAFLQTSQQAVYDPEPLVASLRLDQNEQQDAQEFAKLFTQRLDHEFKKQGARLSAEGGNPDVANLVQTQFEGKMTYGTKCKTCLTSSERVEDFHELEVNLKANCKLEDRIRATLKEEELSGDNQYSCGSCHCKRDATRFTRIETLPPVLHFSLLRFVFNTKEFTRSKSQHSISYPLKLDMGQYLPPDAQGRRPQAWYDLKGVLMHKGKSAHHGHYVAQVQDETEKKWFLFDDEDVSLIDDLNGPDLFDEDGERVQAKKKAVKPNKPGAGFTRDDNGSVLPKSKDAYMLVYTKRPPAASAAVAIPEPPPLAAAKVEELDQKHAALVDEFKARETAIKFDFEKAREAKRSVYRNWDVSAEDEDSFLVDKSELRRWVGQGLAVPKSKAKSSSPSAADKGKGKESPAVEEQHKEASTSTSAADDIEAAAKIANEALGIAPTTSPKASAKLENGAEDVEMREATTTTNGVDQAQVDGSRSSITTTLAGDTSTDSKGSDAIEEMQVDEDGHSSKILSNVGVLCQHDLLDPLKAEQVKRVSQVGVMNLRELGVEIEPKLLVNKDFCRECAWGIAADSFYNRDHDAHVHDFEKEVKARDVDENPAYISRSWLTDWKRTNPKMHVKHTSVDPAPDDAPYQHDVVCEHGKLQPDVKRYTLIPDTAAALLSTIFLTWEVITDSSGLRLCKDCSDAQNEAKASAKEMQDLAKKEKPMFKSFEEHLQPRIYGGGLVVLSNQNNYVIPRSFAREWLNWSRKPATAERPTTVDNDQFMCIHGRVVIDLDREAERPELAAVVTEKQWNALVKSYNASPPVKIFEDEPGKFLTSPAVCDKCLQAKREDFSSAQLAIKTLGEEDFDKDGRRKIRSSSPVEISIKGKGKSTTTTSGRHSAAHTYGQGSRQSARVKQKSSITSKKDLRYIDMKKGDLVKDLKVQISNRFFIPTICQRLFYQNQELESEQTVDEIGLFDGATLELYEVAEDDPDLSKLDDTIDDAALSKGKGKNKRAREEGFGGTGLAGGWDQSQERKDSVEVMEVDSGADAPAEEREDDDDDDHAIVPVSGSKRPRRSTSSAGGGGSTSGASSKRSSTSSTKKSSKGGKKKKDQMDVDEQEEEEAGEEGPLTCDRCTLINEVGAEVCIACDSVLLPPGVSF
ncbi:hypothetical protein BCR35DRAFT_307589 [Leucosporidium creatinivorum]|uniref:Ubiquitinyl hydrolase 1 n=1 Tax=Leucosporidium creatinivorum TaxID=106004 RepID=A0A1Y2EMW4_9BASI|nr:hypothetical protein BCR35DRAFT_307589 [Leucosporidium creatinivorum]